MWSSWIPNLSSQGWDSPAPGPEASQVLGALSLFPLGLHLAGTGGHLETELHLSPLCPGPAVQPSRCLPNVVACALNICFCSLWSPACRKAQPWGTTPFVSLNALFPSTFYFLSPNLTSQPPPPDAPAFTSPGICTRRVPHVGLLSLFPHTANFYFGKASVQVPSPRSPP